MCGQDSIQNPYKTPGICGVQRSSELLSLVSFQHTDSSLEVVVNLNSITQFGKPVTHQW